MGGCTSFTDRREEVMKIILAWTITAAAWFGFGFMVMATIMTA